MVYSIVQVFYFLFDLLSGFVHDWKWGVDISNCNCRTVCPFTCVSFSCIYFRGLLLGVYMFIIVIFSQWISPLIMVKCVSISFVIIFVSEYILPDFSIGSSVLFWLLLACKCFHPFPFNLLMSLNLKYSSCRQYMYSANICLLIEVFNRLAFSVITDKAGFIFVLLLFVLLMSCASLFLDSYHLFLLNIYLLVYLFNFIVVYFIIFI